MPLRSLVALLAVSALSISLAACGREAEKEAQAGAAPDPAAAAPGAPAAAADPDDTRELLAAARDYARLGCDAAKKRLDACRPCETSGQRPLRDLLYAYCAERETPRVARDLYEAIVSAYPGTETSATALMRLRQLEAAEAAAPARSGGGDGAKPVPIARPGPKYPGIAEAAGVEGRVRVRFDVGADGRTANVRVVESEPPLLFDAAALYAVENWSYEPAAADASGQEIVLRFDLAEEGAPAAATAEAPAAAVESAE